VGTPKNEARKVPTTNLCFIFLGQPMTSINISTALIFCGLIVSVSCQSISTVRFSLATPALRDKVILLDSNTPLYNLTTPDVTPYVNTSSGNHSYAILDEKTSQKLAIQDLDLQASAVYTIVGHYTSGGSEIAFTSLADNWNVPVGSAFVRIVNFAAGLTPFDVTVRDTDYPFC
jgi:hypothetical protein